VLLDLLRRSSVCQNNWPSSWNKWTWLASCDGFDHSSATTSLIPRLSRPSGDNGAVVEGRQLESAGDSTPHRWDKLDTSGRRLTPFATFDIPLSGGPMFLTWTTLPRMSLTEGLPR